MADSVLPRMIINLLNGKGVFVPTARAKVIRTIIPMIQQELPLLLEDHLFETINQAAHLRERIEFDLGDTPPADRCPRVHPRFAELVPASERRKWMTFLTLLEAKVDVVRGEAYILKDRPYSNSAYTNTAGFGGRRNLNVALIRTMDAGAQLGAKQTRPANIAAISARIPRSTAASSIRGGGVMNAMGGGVGIVSSQRLRSSCRAMVMPLCVADVVIPSTLLRCIMSCRPSC
ncbi:hypothetical protein PMZ80_007494 [Knufia obscura]|uniref:Uncharacterized protein n=2 Tax=Knufia TaxID=430999 RepID=A0AAN8IND4_9EURO|nr:hypothetical protein PMZ80_007494 [Knufia obscura]KAK5954037.1 hypothetical protein OHC33_004608 [Knufia fluminis]